MEPPHAPITSTTPPLPQPTQDTRHAEMQARFRAQQEARMQSRKENKAKDQLGKDPKESVGVFWTDLRRAHEDVTRRLDSLALTDTSSSLALTDTSSSSSTSVDEFLASLGSKVQALDKQIADAALFLPPYDVRRAQEEATALRGKLEEVRAALAPRKKFSFSARRRPTGASAAGAGTVAAAAAEAAAGDAGEVDASGDGAKGESAGSSTTQKPSISSVPPPSQTSTTTTTSTNDESLELQAMEGFSSLSDATLNLNTLLFANCSSSSSCSSSGSSPTTTHPKDLLLRDLTRCTIHLLVPLDFLRLENLTDCKLLCGPVAGPVYLEKCQGCTLYLASRQLRIHHTYDTTLYVHTVSGPIIEDCDRLRFAPWALTYPGWEEQFVEAGLGGKGKGGREGGRNAWKEVKDFKWLRAQQSPHWSVVPEGERVREEVVEEGKEGGEGGQAEEKEEEEEL